MEKQLKKSFTLAAIVLLSAPMAYAMNSNVSYHIAGEHSDIACHSDGHNIWCPAQQGLLMKGDAVADGDWYFLRGEPDSIEAVLHGRPITILKGRAPESRDVQKARQQEQETVHSRNLPSRKSEGKVRSGKGESGLTPSEERALALAEVPDEETHVLAHAKVKKAHQKKGGIRNVQSKQQPDDTQVKPGSIAALMSKGTGSVSKEVTSLPVDGPVPSVSSSDVKGVSTWRISAGEKIQDALIRWASAGKWQVVYDGPDVSSRVDVEVKDTFENAMNEVIEGLNTSGTPIRAVFYEKNRVIRITGEGSGF